MAVLVLLLIANLSHSSELDAKRTEELALKLNEERAAGRSWVHPLHYLRKPIPAIVPNLRGQVTNVAGELVTVNIGTESGLQVGTVLDVFRLEGGGKTIGTVKVTSALNLFPKQAIVSFTPARRDIPLDRLALEDLPKVGDQVRPPEALDTPAKTEK